jgi:hypothetical protein
MRFPSLAAALDEVAPVASVQRPLVVKAMDADRRIAYAEVYAPLHLDSQGEYMTAVEIEKMAHRFLPGLIGRASKGIDVMHDNFAGRAVPVESFVAREGDPDFTPGAWVLGVRVSDERLWEAIKRGDFSGFSFQARVQRVERELEVDIPRQVTGETVASKGVAAPDHVHPFTVTLNDQGNVVKGQTGEVNGHAHAIVENVRTSISNGHRHVFHIPLRVSA